MDGSQTCECTKETFGCSIHPNTPEAWIASMQDSLAKTLAMLEGRPDLEKALAADFTEKSCELLMSLDLYTCSWKTSRQSSLWGGAELESSSPTFPRWGMTVNGSLYEHPMSALRITEIGGGSLQHWPTPTKSDVVGGDYTETVSLENGRYVRTSKTSGIKFGAKLQHAVTCKNQAKFPTPAARDYKGARKPEAMAATGRNADTNSLPDATEFRGEMGRLNPAWVAWLMGWPIDWTHTNHFQVGGKLSRKSEESQQKTTDEQIRLKHLETGKYPCKPQSLGNCLEVSK
jgi:hypothetical protein